MAEKIGRLKKVDNNLPYSIILYVDGKMFYKKRIDETDVNKIEEYIGKKVKLEYESKKIFENLPVTYNEITNIEVLK